MDHVLSFFGFLSGVLAIVAGMTYIWSILRGETKPDRGAYIVWAATSTVSFLAYWADGAQDSVWFAFGDFIVGLIMLVLAFQYGYGWTNKRHVPALLIAAIGVILWMLTDQPFLALLCSVSVDAVGYTLVVIKSYEAPETESLSSWAIYLAGSILALLAVGQMDFSLLFFPAYLALATTAVMVAILLGRKRAGETKSRPPHKPRKISQPIP